MEIPSRHQAVMPYLIIKGASKFLEFAQNVFHAELAYSTPREDGDTIMHAEMQISGSTIMFAEATEQWDTQPANLFIYVNDADETYHQAISNGATTVNELSDQDYGRTCGVTDPFGNVWWITSVRK